MFDIHKARMFDYDQSAGATADNPGSTATATPPATAAPAQTQQPNGATSPTPEPAADPMAFKLPDSLEGDYAELRGKSVGELLKMNKDLRDKHLRQSNELAELKRGTSTKPGAKPAKGKAEEPAAGEVNADPATGAQPADWNKYLHDYFHDEAADGAAQEFADQFGLPVDIVLKVAETQRKERDAFYKQVEGDLGDITPIELERFMESDASPYDQAEIFGILSLAAKGNTGWVKGVVQQYRDYIGKGGQRFSGSGAPNQPVSSMERGRPAGSETPDIFASRQEYQQALLAANGDSTKMKAADEKMQRSVPYWQRADAERR